MKWWFSTFTILDFNVVMPSGFVYFFFRAPRCFYLEIIRFFARSLVWNCEVHRSKRGKGDDRLRKKWQRKGRGRELKSYLVFEENFEVEHIDGEQTSLNEDVLFTREVQ
jgi:hypothetical protein